MSSRYAVGIHAYCLMDNHYHHIIRTPNANACKALQWLNVSYSAWYNAKRNRAGHVFQGRFSSRLIDNNGSWLLLCSVYVHLNPVRIKPLGFGKRDVRAEASGWKEVSDALTAKRLETLRKSSWSSCLAYAGYKSKPEWLQTGTILGRAGGKRNYREYVEQHITQGKDPAEFETLGGRLAIGSTAFIEKAKNLAGKVTGEHVGREEFRSFVSLDSIADAVGAVRGEEWPEFLSFYGDWGKGMVLYLARKLSGKTLAEIGEWAGGMKYKAVQKTAERFGKKLEKDPVLKRKEIVYA